MAAILDFSEGGQPMILVRNFKFLKTFCIV